MCRIHHGPTSPAHGATEREISGATQWMQIESSNLETDRGFLRVRSHCQ